jgi:hypothetical protein
MKLKSYFILLFILAGLSISNAGNPSSEKEKAREAFKSINQAYIAGDVSMQISYKLFPTRNAVTPSNTATGYYYKQKNNYHSLLMGVETMQNEKYHITVDTSENIIVVANPVKTFFNAAATIDMESALAFCSSIRITEGAKEDIYRLGFNSERFEYSSIDISVDKYDHYIRKVTLYWKEGVSLNDEEEEKGIKNKPRVEIDYVPEKRKSASLSKEFSETPYFSMQQGKLIPASKFKGFKIMDQRVR